MTSRKQPGGGAEGYFEGPDRVWQVRLQYIARMLGVLDTASEGAQTVHILHPADFLTRKLRKNRLVEFSPRPEEPWVNGEQQVGWIIHGVVRPTPEELLARPGARRSSLLLLADTRCAHGGPPPAWLRTNGGLYVPHDRLMPLEQTPDTVNLQVIEQELLPLLPEQYHREPIRLLAPPPAS